MHAHTGMTLLRGYADDLCLSKWLSEEIWPAEGKFVSAEFVECSSRLAIAESIRNGCTLLNDMYFFPDATYRVAQETGINIALGQCVMDFPTSYANNPDEYLAKAQENFKKVSADQSASDDKSRSLIVTTVAPHAPYTVSDPIWKRCVDLCESTGMKMHTHLHETSDEVTSSSTGQPNGSMVHHRSEKVCRPLSNMQDLGVISDRLLAVHMTQLNDEEIRLCASHNASVVHCPSSNLKLASGICPLSRLSSAGVNCCIGTDSSASNNTLSMWNELRLASLLAKVRADDSTAVPCDAVLRMATINGARALGLSDRTGSLEIGKRADFIAVRLDALELIPMYDVRSHLAYCVSGCHVDDTWVAGRQLMRQRKLLTIDEEKLRADVNSWQLRLAEHRAASRADRKRKADQL